MREEVVKRFATEYLKANCNATKAAENMGLGSTYAAAKIAGHRALKRAEAAGYIEAVTDRLNEKAILSLEETLEVLSEQAVGAKPTKVVKKYMRTMTENDGKAMVEWVPGEERHYDKQKAAATLMQHYKPAGDKNVDARKLVLIQLGNAEPEKLMSAVAGLLEQGGE